MNEYYNKWTVMKCPKCKKTQTFYTNGESLKEAGFDSEELTCYNCNIKLEIVSDDKWSAETWAEIIGCELEDKNKHSQTHIPYALLSILNTETTLSETDKIKILRKFAETIL